MQKASHQRGFRIVEVNDDERGGFGPPTLFISAFWAFLRARRLVVTVFALLIAASRHRFAPLCRFLLFPKSLTTFREP